MFRGIVLTLALYNSWVFGLFGSQVSLNSIQTYKWLPLMYQLAARMDVKPHKDIPQQFLNTLNKVNFIATECLNPYFMSYSLNYKPNSTDDVLVDNV